MKDSVLILNKIRKNAPLARQEVFDGCKNLLDLPCRDDIRVQLSMILYGLDVKGPSKEEILGLVDFLNHIEPHLAKKLQPKSNNAICLAGSGKKELKTFNISTSAALVVASLGYPVAKLVSRATSSLTGSTDVLSLLGAELNIPITSMIEIMDDLNFGAFSIENTIPNFDKIYGGIFHTPHAFSYILPALLSPVKCNSVAYGLTQSDTQLSEEVFKELNLYKTGGIVTTNVDGLLVDELLPIGKNNISIIDQPHATQEIYEDLESIRERVDCKVSDISALNTKQEQAELLKRLLEGKASDQQAHIVALNAAFIIKSGNPHLIFSELYKDAWDIILSGKSAQILKKFIEKSNIYKK